MSIINSHQPYPGTEADCTKTSDLQHLLDHFQTVEVYSNYSLILFNFEFFYRKQLTMLNNISIQNPFIANLWKAFDTFTIHSPTSNHLIEYNLMYFYWHENEKFKGKNNTRTQKRNKNSFYITNENVERKRRMQFLSFFIIIIILNCRLCKSNISFFVRFYNKMRYGKWNTWKILIFFFF